MGYNGLCFEACKAISDMSDAPIIAPEDADHGSLWRLASRTRYRWTGLNLSAARPQPIRDRHDLLLYVCMAPQNLVTLQMMSGWRENSRKAVAFVFETWSARAHEHRQFIRLFDQFDHVFLFNPNSVEAVQRYTTAKCSYLPAAADCLEATPVLQPGPRPIDVFGMGRTSQAVHDQLVELTRRRKLLYLWEGRSSRVANGYPEARFRTYHHLRSSRFFLSFNFQIQSHKNAESKGEEAMPARIFEGAAAGTVMIGSAPRLREYDQLFDWPDALIDIPMDPVDMEAFYDDLQRQPERIRTAGLTSAAQSLRRHDWAYRWEEILRTLDLPIPPGVIERKARLATLADKVEEELGPAPTRAGVRSGAWPSRSGQEALLG